VDETADIGNFNDFKDSTSIEASTAATCKMLMITTDWVSDYGCKTILSTEISDLAWWCQQQKEFPYSTQLGYFIHAILVWVLSLREASPLWYMGFRTNILVSNVARLTISFSWTTVSWYRQGNCTLNTVFYFIIKTVLSSLLRGSNYNHLSFTVLCSVLSFITDNWLTS
jgi:hypothetical protein